MLPPAGTNGKTPCFGVGNNRPIEGPLREEGEMGTYISKIGSKFM